MSRWEQDRHIGTELSQVTGELMLSMSDVVAWLRDRATAPQSVTRELATVADDLADSWIELERHLLDGGG